MGRDLSGAKQRRLVYPQSRCYNFSMNKPLKLIAIGNSTGLILPKEMLAALGVEQGGEVSVTASPGRIEIEAKDDDFERQIAIARDVMHRRRRALRELAR